MSVQLSDSDWLLRRKLEMRSARMLRFIDMATNDKPILVGWVVSKEADLIRAALADIEERWGDRETADAMASDEKDDA